MASKKKSTSESLKSLTQEIRRSCKENNTGKENFDRIISRIDDFNRKHEKSKVGPLQDSMDALRTDIRLANQLCEKMDQLKTKRQKINHRIKEVESFLVDSKSHHNDIELFKEYGGVSLTSDENGIVLKFTNIDPNDNTRQFSITLSINDTNRQWTFVSADPHIDDISHLISQLNTTNNIHLFCSQLRKFYKQSFCI